MKRHILWIDDDAFIIRPVFRPLERMGFVIDIAASAEDGFMKAHDWEKYDLILVDMVLLSSRNDTGIPQEVQQWKKEKYIGIGLVKWLLEVEKVKCPVMVLSILSSEELLRESLGELQVAGYISKFGLRPSTLKEAILDALGS